MTALLTEMAHDLRMRLSEELTRREGERLKRQVLRGLVSITDILAEVILKAWKWVRETLEVEGFEGRQLARQCKLLLDAIDWILPAYERFVAQAEESGLTAEAAGLSDLEAKLPALREARPKVAETLDLATRPPRSVKEAMLDESKGALDRGEFVTLDDEYLARLRAGEDF
jgi:hypothetical protein